MVGHRRVSMNRQIVKLYLTLNAIQIITSNLCAKSTWSSFTKRSFESHILTSVLMISLGLLVRNSIDMQGTSTEFESIRLRFPTQQKKEALTRASVNRIRFPVRVCMILQLGLLEGLNGFVFVHQVGYDASDCIWAFSAK
jgi:hypothetical protein